MILSKDRSKTNQELINSNFVNLNSRVKELDKIVGGLKTLAIDIYGEDAVDLHTCLTGKERLSKK